MPDYAIYLRLSSQSFNTITPTAFNVLGFYKISQKINNLLVVYMKEMKAAKSGSLDVRPTCSHAQLFPFGNWNPVLLGPAIIYCWLNMASLVGRVCGIVPQFFSVSTKRAVICSSRFENKRLLHVARWLLAGKGVGLASDVPCNLFDYVRYKYPIAC